MAAPPGLCRKQEPLAMQSWLGRQRLSWHAGGAPDSQTAKAAPHRTAPLSSIRPAEAHGPDQRSSSLRRMTSVMPWDSATSPDVRQARGLCRERAEHAPRELPRAVLASAEKHRSSHRVHHSAATYSFRAGGKERRRDRNGQVWRIARNRVAASLGACQSPLNKRVKLDAAPVLRHCVVVRLHDDRSGQQPAKLASTNLETMQACKCSRPLYTAKRVRTSL